MATTHVEPTFCLIVPSGTWRPDALVQAILEHHPRARVVGVWCGDPHHRPPISHLSRFEWCDVGLEPPDEVGWGLRLVALPPRTFEWLRTSLALQRLVAVGEAHVIVLRVGSVAVLGPCSTLTTGDSPIILAPRVRGRLPDDGLAPREDHLLERGAHSVAFAAFGPGSQEALAWLASSMSNSDVPVGRWLERMARLFGAAEAGAAEVAAPAWASSSSESVDVTASILDLDELDRDEPWHFTFGPEAARVRFSRNPQLASAIVAAHEQIDGAPMRLRLPGGVLVDAAMSRAVRRVLADTVAESAALPAEPFGPDGSSFLRWLEESDAWGADVGRYWLELRVGRPDLQTVFPKPQSLDADRFRDWIDTAWRLEPERSALLGSRRTPGRDVVSAGHDPSGINVLGYFDFDQSQGHIARRIVAALESAGVGAAPINYHRSRGSRRPNPINSERSATFSTNLVVVNADQFEFVVADHGETLLSGRRTIGYWFWELEHVPAALVAAIDWVDEIWTGSQFVADAFARLTSKPVRCVPLPVAEPSPSALSRASMGVPDDAYLFVTTFDQFSVPERKNPFGTIDAFSRAFAEGAGPILLIKTMNGDKGWRNKERLLLAASARSDVVVWDEHLSRADQMAVIANADCLVSLHRSEGLGLHCAEAMWLGKPVIATRYSGNLDFMDDSVAALVDFEYVGVTHGEGIYPSTARWADPDLDHAAYWMRRLAEQPYLGVQMGHRARQQMLRQPTLEETGRAIARAAGVMSAT